MRALTSTDCNLDPQSGLQGPPGAAPRLRSEVRRWIVVFLMLLAAAAAFHGLYRFFSTKFYRVTGEAQWIWKHHRYSSQEPVVFFATRNFVLPEHRPYVHIKVAGDPEYTLYFNGREIGGASSDEVQLSVYDVSSLARTGVNRVVAAVRSGNGVGGFLLSIDLAPIVQNFVVTDEKWGISTTWSDLLLTRDPAGVERPAVLGKPPYGRWNYPQELYRGLYPDVRFIIHPANTMRFETTLPEIRAVGGVAITISRPASATAFDFGSVHGRGRVEIGASREKAVLVRYANEEGELRGDGRLHPFVFATGERAVVDPDERVFRYMIVYDTDAQASVITSR